MRRVPAALLAMSLLLVAPTGFAQQSSRSSLIAFASDPAPGAAPAISRVPQPMAVRRPFQTALGVKVSPLGIGVETAVPLSSRFNLRAGTNFFGYGGTFSSSGVNYTANLHFLSVETSLDWFPWGRSFHISPGALIYNGNRITGNALIPAGDNFTLNGTSYVSDPADPAHGSGNLQFAEAAPKLTIGWGNLVPRIEKHFSFPVELGFAYMGDPKVALHFTGSVCDSGMQGCQSIANDQAAQANVAAEQQRLYKDARYARFFPLLSTGFAYRF
jgi:hypothetical protein